MTKKIQKIFGVLLIITSIFTLSGCGLRDNSSQYTVTLEVWGVFDDSDVYESALAKYQEINPHVKIEYKKFNIDTYKQDIIEAMAAGNGPDIFMVRNSWIPSFQDKIIEAPDTLAIDERSFRNAFVDVVADDFISADKKVYSVPLSVDSLGLYYNKDLFNAAGILNPPKTWDEFNQDVALLSKVDGFGNVVQSGAAMGTAYNINRSTDILSALMFQKGDVFNNIQEASDIKWGNAKSVFDFYTQYTNTSSVLYSWNPRMHYSIDAFYEGQTAMMINYSWQYATLKKKNAKLNIATAPLPQFSSNAPANYANYWGYVVAKNKQFGPEVTDIATQNKIRVFESWQLLKYMTFPNNGKFIFQNALSGNTLEVALTSDFAKDYVEKTGKPAARRDLIEKQKTDVVLGPFAEGNIIAKNWQQTNPEAIEGILAEMIDSVNRGESATDSALRVAGERISRIEK